MTQTGTKNELADELWKTFKEWWPPWLKHVDHWETWDDESIAVYFKRDGYYTDGCTYIFGQNGEDAWSLRRIQR